MSLVGVSEIVSNVRSILDLNASSSGMESMGTLTVEDIIRDRLPASARFICLKAPTSMLGEGETSTLSAKRLSTDKDGDFVRYDTIRIALPDDFLRLITFKMSHWSRAVGYLMPESSAEYKMMQSKYAGIRGDAENPKAAIVIDELGDRAIECTGCGEDVLKVSRFRYLSDPRIDSSDNIQIPKLLVNAIEYYTAYLTAIALSMGDVAQSLMQTAMSMIGAEING